MKPCGRQVVLVSRLCWIKDFSCTSCCEVEPHTHNDSMLRFQWPEAEQKWNTSDCLEWSVTVNMFTVVMRFLICVSLSVHELGKDWCVRGNIRVKQERNESWIGPLLNSAAMCCSLSGLKAIHGQRSKSAPADMFMLQGRSGDTRMLVFIHMGWALKHRLIVAVKPINSPPYNIMTTSWPSSIATPS